MGSGKSVKRRPKWEQAALDSASALLENNASWTSLIEQTFHGRKIARRVQLLESLEPRLLLSSVVPTGWTDSDIGSPALAGSATFTASSGAWSNTAGGTDIGGTSDQFNFASETLTGNGTAIVKVGAVGNTNAAAKAGLMLRASTAAGDAFADIVLTPSNGVMLQSRLTSGAAATATTVSAITAPQWLELVRSGTATSTTITGSYSADGKTWTQVGAVPMGSFANAALLGLAVTADNTSALNTSTFSNLSVTSSPPTVATAAAASPNPVTGTTTNLSVLGADLSGESNLTYTWAATSPAVPVTFSANGTNAAKNTVATFTAAGNYTLQVTITDPSGQSTTSSVIVKAPTVSLPAGWTDSDIGSPGKAGSAQFSSGNWTVSGGGSDIWGSSDLFNYAWENFSGDGILTAHVTSVSNADPWSKAGVMIRASTAANSAFADVVVTPGQGASFQWRGSTGGSPGDYQTSGIVAPQWVKLQRYGSTFAGYFSSDGVTWTQVGGPVTLSMPTASVVGLAVTAHNNSLLSTATFTNVSMAPNTAPTIATAAAANPATFTGYTTNLSVLGADDGGEPSLTYSWATTGTPPAPVTFSDNGDNSAKNTTVSFTLSGTYSFVVTITDTSGLTATSNVTVNATVPPLPPTGVAPMWSGSAVNLTWLPAARAQSYNIYRSTTPGGEGSTPIATGITSTSYADTSVVSGQQYYYQVTTVDSSALESYRSFEALALTSIPTTPIISEFVAINNNGLADAEGNHPDWLELFNPTLADVNMAGYYLTDKSSNLTEWQMPAVTIPSGGFLVIFADGENLTDPSQTLHTNFSLSGSGEYLALVAPDGHTVLSSYNYPQQLADVAYGTGISEAVTPLIAEGAAAKTLVPTDGTLGTTWTQTGFNDSTWTSGTTGVGYETQTAMPTLPGFSVRMVDTQGGTDGSLDNISKATALLNGTSPTGAFIVVFDGTADRSLVNLGSGGDFTNDLTLPNGTGGSAGDDTTPGRTDYALRVTADVTIPAGTYTVDVNSDDGFRLQIPGITFTNRVNENFTGATNPSPADTLVFGAPRGASDTLGTFTIPAGGLTTTINLDYYEHTGGDELELAIASGQQTAFSSTAFSLLGNGVLGWQVMDPNGPMTPNYASLIGTNVQTQMYNTGLNSAYVRIPFTVSNPSALAGLRLQVKYDDGFVAYVNGQQVASRNAPASPTWNSAASATHPDAQGIVYETISIPASDLVAGTNELAIQGLNATNDQANFLIYPILNNLTVSFGAVGYLPAAPGAHSGQILGSAIVPEPTFSQPHGFYNGPFQLSISDAMPGAQIRYSLNGTVPTATTGTLYTGPITISGQTDIRAVAFFPGDIPSFPDTATYIYVNQVITQDSDGLPPPGWPSSWGNSVEHYGMDPRVVNNSLYSSEIAQDLLDIPTFSLTMNLNDLFSPTTGIYSNTQFSGKAWERPGSIELMNPDGSGGFQANVGVRIHGGASSYSPDAKHGFRIIFSSQYGQSELDYPLFGPNGAKSYQEFDLRTDQNNSWQYSDPSSYIGIRDEFGSGSLAAEGEPAEHTFLCFLYIDGVFWGLYAAMERPDANFAASYFGGSATDYDVIKSGGEPVGWTLEATNGTMNVWTQLFTDLSTLDMSNNANYEMIQGNNPDGTPNSSLPKLLDVDNLIDYMLLIYYQGNLDAPNSNFLGNLNPNNFYAIRPIDGSFGFRFVATDSEWTLLDPATNRVNTAKTPTLLTSNPAYFFQQLEPNALFRMLVADHIQKQFFNGGPFSVAGATAQFTSLENQIYGPVVLESARWGDVLRPSNPYTRDVEWQAEINRIQTQYLPTRTNTVIGQLQAVGLFPSVAAPLFSQDGGSISSGYQLTMTNPNSAGIIYYTLDGSDPWQPDGSVSPTALAYSGPITLNGTTRVKARVLNGSTWSAVEDVTFIAGPSPIRITELDYDPSAPPSGSPYDNDSFEFIELRNFSPRPVNLQNYAFTNGISYTFGNVILGPWQTGVLVANTAAFQSRYGTTPYIIGDYESTTQHFSNSGEQVELVDNTGQILANFLYSPTWYPSTKGGGATLEVVDPTSNPDLNSATSWRASAIINGTPGTDGPAVNLSGNNITVALDADGVHLDTTVDGVPAQYVLSQIDGVVVSGSGSSNLSVDESHGMVPSLTYTGATLNVIGTSTNDSVDLSGNMLTINDTKIALTNVSHLSYTAPGGNNSINLTGSIPTTLDLASGNSTVTNGDSSPVFVAAGTGKTTINATAGTTIIPASSGTGIQQLDFAAINISTGANVVFANTSSTLGNYSNHANRTLAIVDAGGLNIASGGTLDLGDNSMLLKYLAANKAATDSMINSLVTSGYAGGAWSGTGITSSEANFDAFNGAAARAVGWADQLDVGVNSFEGDSVDVADGNEIMIKFTYYGDSDLDGKVASSDSANFSTGVHLTGNAFWEFGDFDYSGGKPTASDSQVFSTGLAAYKTFGQL